MLQSLSIFQTVAWNNLFFLFFLVVKYVYAYLLITLLSFSDWDRGVATSDFDKNMSKTFSLKGPGILITRTDFQTSYDPVTWMTLVTNVRTND